MELSIGRIVHYRVKGDDLRRAATNPGHLPGACLYEREEMDESDAFHQVDRLEWAGNVIRPGDTFPLVVVRPWHQLGHYTAGESTLNGQVLLDGPGTLWALSVAEGEGPGTWSWPPRV